MEQTSEEMKNDGRCSLISSGSLGQKREKVGISYRLHFIVSSEKHLPIHRGGHGGLGKQTLDSSFALCDLFYCLTGKLCEGGRYHPEPSICLPSKLLPLYCTLWSQNGREGRRRGIQWGSSGLPVQEQSSVLPTRGVGDKKINKDGRYCGSQRRHP